MLEERVRLLESDQFLLLQRPVCDAHARVSDVADGEDGVEPLPRRMRTTGVPVLAEVKVSEYKQPHVRNQTGETETSDLTIGDRAVSGRETPTGRR